MALIEVPVVSKPHQASQSRCAVYAMKHGLQYACVDRSALHQLSELLPQWQIDLVITYSVPYLKLQWLESLRYGAINVHHALLPAYRGGNPLLWQVIDDVEELGVSVHCVSERLDSGGILAQSTMLRPHGIPKPALAKYLNTQCGLALLLSVIPAWVNGSLKPTEQPQISPTPAANHIPPEELLSVLNSRRSSINCVWEVAQLLKIWPDKTLNRQRWCQGLEWVPFRKVVLNQPVTEQENSSDSPSEKSYEFSPNGYETHLCGPQGYVVFRPKRFVYARVRFYMSKLLFKARSWRRHQR